MWLKFFVPESVYDADEWTDSLSVVIGGTEPVSGSDEPHQIVFERITSMHSAPGEPVYVTYAGSDQQVDVSGIQGAWCLVASPEAECADLVRHTACKHCGMDIEGFLDESPVVWHDRGNNTQCPHGEWSHEPVPE